MPWANGKVPISSLVHLGGEHYLMPGTYQRWLGSLVFDTDVAAGAHTLNVAGQIVVGGAFTVNSNAATSRSYLTLDWLG